MRPIPRTLLIHAATLAQAVVDEYGSETLSTLAQLQNVRVEADCSETLMNDDTRSSLSALLLYDAHNSRPRGIAFEPGQRVVYNSVRYRVQAVEELYDGRRLHHVELNLCE
jgi:hypothetical protein